MTIAHPPSRSGATAKGVMSRTAPDSPSIRLAGDRLGSFAAASQLEWIDTNGLGGWASSSVAGAHTRRYHGLLVAATRPPLGRMVLLSKLDETLDLGPERIDLGSNQFPGAIHPQGHRFLHAFERGTFPAFEYRVGDVRLEKTVAAIHGENTTVVVYRLPEAPGPVMLELRPLLAGRDYHALQRADGASPGFAFENEVLRAGPFANDTMLHLAVPGGRFEPGPDWWYHFEYERERERGLDHHEDLWTPGVFRVTVAPGETIGVIASTGDPAGQDPERLLGQERRRRDRLLERLPLQDHVTVPLARAADQFLVRRGEGLRTVIAGYHWFGDWGRDTLIALPGLTLATGRPDDARLVLRAFAEHVDRGMLPNRFPDQDDLPEYNTADATLWFFVALRAYVRSTADTSLATELLPMLRDVIRWHREGTRFAIRVDGDGLLRAGEPGVQLTWMDARVGDRVVTPRSGKPVEINALWYNALRILAELEAGFGNPEAGAALGREADRVHRRFSRTFWYAEGGYLYDVVDGEAKDTALRPNQILACSLPFPLLSSARRRSVLRVVEEQLLTPVGLRSLAPNHPSYRPHYDGDVLTRDSAYHQGTVWPWLLGPWVTAVVREWGARGRMAAAELIERAVEHLSTAGVGTFSEIFDGDPPHAPRGAIAQAWSIAELLRAWVEDVNGVSHCPAAPRRLGRDRGIVTSRVRVLDTPERVAAAAADLFVEAARGAIASRGRFGVALSGGRTPETVYDLLAGPPRRGFVDWPRVHLFWGDERCVPPEHPDSNYGAAERALLRHVPLDQAQVHRIRGEIAPHQAADEYEAELLAYLHERPGPGSVLDLVLLGLGADGHTASLFPDTEAFRRALAGEETRWVVANNVPALDAWRVTLTTRAINGSRRVAVLVTGAAKAVALREVLAAGPDAAPQLPIQLVNSAAGQVDWLVDSAAAALLPAPGGRGR